MFMTMLIHWTNFVNLNFYQTVVSISISSFIQFFKNPDLKHARYAEVLMDRLASVRDVANAALFLFSDEASFLTGVALPVDRGMTAA